MHDAAAMKTTRAARDVITIADIEALESRPYDELIPARTLIDLFAQPRTSILIGPRSLQFQREGFPTVRQQSRIATCIKGWFARRTCFTTFCKRQAVVRSLSWVPLSKE